MRIETDSRHMEECIKIFHTLKSSINIEKIDLLRVEQSVSNISFINITCTTSFELPDQWNVIVPVAKEAIHRSDILEIAISELVKHLEHPVFDTLSSS